MPEKIDAAKQYLGTAWVLHPNYNPKQHPAHTTRGAWVLENYRKDQK